MKDIITIDTKAIAQFVEEGGRLVFKNEAEEAIIKLLDLIDFLNDGIEKVKENILVSGRKILPEFAGVKGKAITLYIKRPKKAYGFSEATPHEYLREIVRVAVDEEKVEAYRAKHKKLPKDITEKTYEEKVVIQRKKQDE